MSIYKIMSEASVERLTNEEFNRHYINLLIDDDDTFYHKIANEQAQLIKNLTPEPMDFGSFITYGENAKYLVEELVPIHADWMLVNLQPDNPYVFYYVTELTELLPKLEISKLVEPWINQKLIPFLTETLPDMINKNDKDSYTTFTTLTTLVRYWLKFYPNGDSLKESPVSEIFSKLDTNASYPSVRFELFKKILDRITDNYIKLKLWDDFVRNTILNDNEKVSKHAGITLEAMRSKLHNEFVFMFTYLHYNILNDKP